MSTKFYKGLALLLLVVSISALALAWNVWWNYLHERANARTVWNTMVGYEITRNRLKEMTIEDEVAYLDFYKPNKLLSEDVPLNLIMDQERRRIIRDLIVDLKKKSGESLGDDPDVWLKKYGYDSTNVAPTTPRK